MIQGVRRLQVRIFIHPVRYLNTYQMHRHRFLYRYAL